MNKILVYTVIAILLGAATMTIPLLALEPQCDPNLLSDDSSLFDSEANTLEHNDLWVRPESHEATLEPSEADTKTNTLPQEPELCETRGESISFSGLTSVGLMMIPSFLIALGIFFYLKKRTV